MVLLCALYIVCSISGDYMSILQWIPTMFSGMSAVWRAFVSNDLLQLFLSLSILALVLKIYQILS